MKTYKIFKKAGPGFSERWVLSFWTPRISAESASDAVQTAIDFHASIIKPEVLKETKFRAVAVR